MLSTGRWVLGVEYLPVHGQATRLPLRGAGCWGLGTGHRASCYARQYETRYNSADGRMIPPHLSSGVCPGIRGAVDRLRRLKVPCGIRCVAYVPACVVLLAGLMGGDLMASVGLCMPGYTG